MIVVLGFLFEVGRVVKSLEFIWVWIFSNLVVSLRGSFYGREWRGISEVERKM